ncbi:MAG TPA: serine hydrolase, partial [Prolixibacteraceae bacterium]|nr:serine hydrolase [Prolixibacteraceae bacterium]
GRDPARIIENDLDYSFVKYTTSKINYEEKSVTTSFFGLAKQKAVFREGFGCCLVDEEIPAELKTPWSLPKIANEQSWKNEWPDGDAPCDTVFPEMDPSLLRSALDDAFDKPGEKLKRTAAVVVAYKGKLVGEKYWEEQSVSADTRLWGWSMNKSIVNAMVGVLVRQGKLSTDATAPVEEWLQDKRREITINDLMQMSSGLEWNEDYGDLSDVTAMLYKERNCYKYASSFPYDKKPGTEWKYSSGTTNILSGIIRKALNDDNLYHELPYTEIFRKTGMNSMILEYDASGYFVGSSYGYATAKDWAKFGQLYLQDGVWKGDSILPKGWVAYTSQPAKAANGRYGAMFWLNRSGELKDAPEDMISCNGHRGQRVFIIPSRDLVVVRLGFAEDNFDDNQFLKAVLGAFRHPE